MPDSPQYALIAMNEFLELFRSLEGTHQKRIEKIKAQLKSNPFVGKPLGSKWFREKKINGFRLYFLIYEKQKIVSLISFSDKKSQQKTIDEIRLRFEQYKEGIMKINPSV